MRDVAESEAGGAGERMRALLVCALMAAFWWAMRWPHLGLDVPLNPDEAQVGAAALRALEDPVLWRSVHLHTVGPLAALLHAWPHLIGWEITISTVRLTGYALEAITFAAFGFATWRLAPRALVLLAFAPAVAASALNAHPDMLHAASEKPPIAATAVALALIARAWGVRRVGPLFGAGLALGLVPFLKLQGAPIALAAGLLALWVGWRVAGVRGAAVPAVAALIGAVALIAPLAATGEIELATRGWLGLGVDYVTPFSSDILLLSGALMGPLALLSPVAAIAGVAILARRRLSTWRPVDVGLACAVAWMTLSIIVAWLPGRTFTHYAHFALAGWAALAALLVGAIAPDPSAPPDARVWTVARWARVSTIALAALVVATGLRFAPSQIDARERLARLADAAPRFGPAPGPPLLQPLAPSAKRLFVWGWTPELYLASDLGSLSRDGVISFLVEFERESQIWHADELMRQARRAGPFAVLDTARLLAPNPSLSGDVERAFPTFMATHGPGLARVGPSGDAPGEDPRCPRLFVPREDAARLAARRIAPRAVTGGPSAPGHGVARAVDLQVTDRCADAWRLPDGATGSIGLRFDPEPVARVAILATRGGVDADRGVGVLRVRASLAGREIAPPQEVRALAWPHWTVVDLPAAGAIDAVEIEIASTRGRGGGVNEVLLLRPEP